MDGAADVYAVWSGGGVDVAPNTFIAVAITLDEFALWLNLKDVYWERQGRESFEALGLFGALLIAGISGGPFFRGVARKFLQLLGTSTNRNG